MVLHNIFLQLMSSNWEEYIEDLRAQISDIVSHCLYHRADCASTKAVPGRQGLLLENWNSLFAGFLSDFQRLSEVAIDAADIAESAIGA